MQIDEKLITDFIQKIDWEKVCNSSFSAEDPEYVTDHIDHKLFYVECGVTKMVLIPKKDTQDFVIKIPFNSYWVIDDKDDSYSIDLERAWYPIQSSQGWNYCQSELEFYELAKQHSIDQFFPQTIKYNTSVYPIYIQERCRSAECDWSKNLFESKEEGFSLKEMSDSLSNKQRKIFRQFDNNWLYQAIKFYGITALSNLLNFLIYSDLNDFHGGNYGYLSDTNKPVIIDFSGFFEVW